MRIAVLGFDNLVNNQQSLSNNHELHVKKPSNDFHSNINYNIKTNSSFVEAEGLKLPIRLGRISSANTPDRRITVALHPGASNEQVFFSESKFTNLNQALRNLREREGISTENYKSIGYVNVVEDTKRAKSSVVASKVSDWARRNGYDAVIWSDLTTKGVQFGERSTGREIIPLLEQDPILLKNTQKYIRDLPVPNSLHRDICALQPAGNEDYKASLTADFAQRDAMPQTNTPKADWFKPAWGMWGPFAKKFPAPKIPENIDQKKWKQDRIVEAAMHFKGLPYKRWSDGMRGHFPGRGCGLDCSNFAAWVYNYGLGINFSSSVDELVSGRSAGDCGPKIAKGEQLKKGDLLLFDGNPRHVVIYIDENHVIDSTSGQRGGVDVRDLRKSKNSWCRPDANNPRYLFARRPIE